MVRRQRFGITTDGVAIHATFAAAQPSVSTWTMLGQRMQRVLTNPLRLRVFNGGMALLLLASLYPVIFRA